MIIALIRHSITQGNLEQRYIGSTDQPLCDEGKELAKRVSNKMPSVERVFCSPMLRARQTAALLFPQHSEHLIVEGLQECGFGACEGMTHQELLEQEDFRQWLQEGKTLPPPGGEEPSVFARRSRESFLAAIEQLYLQEVKTAAFVLHGGIIMSLMSQLATPQQNFYEWRTKNCEGFILENKAFNEPLTLIEPIRHL